MIKRDRAMRHPAQLGHDIGALLDLLELEESARREELPQGLPDD